MIQDWTNRVICTYRSWLLSYNGDRVSNGPKAHHANQSLSDYSCDGRDGESVSDLGPRDRGGGSSHIHTAAVTPSTPGLKTQGGGGRQQSHTASPPTSVGHPGGRRRGWWSWRELKGVILTQ